MTNQATEVKRLRAKASKYLTALMQQPCEIFHPAILKYIRKNNCTDLDLEKFAY